MSRIAIGTMRVISAKDVHALLDMEHCMERVRHAFTLEAGGKALQPIRTKMDLPDGRGLLGMMPGAIVDPPCFGIKVVSVFPENFAAGMRSHQGLVILFESTQGRPIAALEAGSITAIRTAAASAVATDILARKDATILAVYGYGEQAHVHIEAICRIRRISRILVWGRNPDRAEAFVEEHRKSTGCDVSVARDPAEAAACADIICTTTASREAFFCGDWLKPGTHLNVVGASVPTVAEVDTETVLRSRVYADYVDSALALAGELRTALGSNTIERTHILGSVGEVILGRVPGRTAASEITLFRSLGMIVEDLVTAEHVLRLAAERNIGSLVSL